MTLVPRRTSFLPAVALLILATVGPATAQIRPSGYHEAEAAYEASYTVEQRLIFQVLLTAAGYWNAVPNENFNQRLFRAVQRFQTENGFAADGIVTKALTARLFAVAGPMLDLWGFRKVTHPARRVTIWVPFGLGLRATRAEYGLSYADPQNRLKLNFTTVPNLDWERNYAAVVNTLLSEGATVHYKVAKDGWFVVSATSADGIDHYFRYHQDGTNVTGFTLSWKNANGNVSGERVAVLMSASLWSDMMGTAFIDPPPSSQPQVASRVQPAPAPPADPALRPSPPVPTPKVEAKVSTGTGFFVTGEGHFVTNAHVVEDCGTVRVKTDDGAVQEARLVAKDAVNDLALFKLMKGTSKFASLRPGVRLGEGVAAFGFPHTDLLSTSGNFTLGNVTALTGMGDDVRYVQVSAPVQHGNSGGPLLDTSGNLVGVVTAKLNALKMAASNGDLPQNVNFAVKAAILSTFLDANRVSYTGGVPGPKPLEPADIADQAKAISGFIVCR